MLHLKAEVVKKANQPDGVIEAVVGSSNAVDRMGEVISQDGWILDNYMKNPVILWGHNVREERPPIGRAIKVWLEGAQKKTKRLMFTVQFDLLDSFAAEIYRKVKDGFVNTVSVGFIPLEMVDNTFTKSELLELSFVPVPANPEALVQLRGMGIEPVESFEKLYPNEVKKDVVEEEPKVEEKEDESKEEKVEDTPTEEKEEEKTEEKVDTEKVEEKVEDEKEEEKTETVTVTEEKVEEPEPEEKVEEKVEELAKEDVSEEVEDEDKAVSPYKDLGMAPESDSWDMASETKNVGTDELKLMCAWYDKENSEDKGSYKLLHHKGTGNHEAVWRAVAGSMALLLGAKGGVEIPEEDRKGVFNHLKKHYEQFGKEAPEFRAVEEQVLKTYDEEIHALVLDREDKYTVRLIKKVLEVAKETKKEVKKEVPVKRTPNEAELKAAMEVLDLALSNVFKGSKNGGDK